MKIKKPTVFGFLALASAVLAGLVLMRLFTTPPAPGNAEPQAQNETPPAQAETTAPRPTAPAQPASLDSATATRSVSAPAPARLWATPAETTGEKLDPKSASYAAAQRAGIKLKGRSAPFDPDSLSPLAVLRRGDNVVIPLLGGEQVAGKVNLVQQEADGWVRVGGELTGARAGSFSLGSSGKKVGGTILLPQEEIAYEIAAQPGGQVVMQEKPLSEVICFAFPRAGDEPTPVVRTLGPQEAPPILSSRPGATAVLYLDFDGETVTDPSWNNGNTIVAQPSSLTSAEITEVWKRVKEDYWPFNIDVTTDLTRYNNAAVGNRMRCVVTPTDTAAPGVGGIAYVNSFDRAGQSGFSTTIPCWCFIQDVVGAALVISHELGHTLGLRHDGRNSPVEEYYQGHGTGAVGWAPIMGGGGKQLLQWSKGEYANANNQEDDLAIIAGPANGFGYVADEAGDSLGSAAALTVSGNAVNRTGIIAGTNDVDFYFFTVGAGVVSLNANPAAISPNLDILLQLLDSAGSVVASSNPDTDLNATVRYAAAAGTYYLKVQGTGRGAVLGDGYSSYGSIGHYSLFGGINLVPPTITAQPLSRTVIGGTNVTFSVSASGSPPLSYQWRRNGVSIPGATNASYTITNVQSSHTGNYTVEVSNGAGTVTSGVAVLFVIAPPSITAQPQSQTITAGTSVEFFVTALGTAPLSYQWFFNGQPISTATNSSYSIARVQSNQAGTYTVFIRNAFGAVLSAPATLAISSGSAFGIIGASFRYQIVANNNPTWYSANSLPDGLRCDGPSGVISGTPTKTGTFPVTVKAESLHGSVATTIAFTIAAGAITSENGVLGIVGAPFIFQIAADNSPTWYSAGSLPDGLRCDGPSGVISGTPTRTGTFLVSVKAENRHGSATAAMTLFIVRGIITSATDAEGILGAPFSYQIAADNNPTWYTAGSLPDGLRCDGESGVISGIPTQTGTFLVPVEAESLHGTARANLAITITNGTITSASETEGIIGVPFSYQIAADNNPHWFAASSLPDGLRCDGPSGVISGIPTQTGTFLVPVEAENLHGSATATLAISITNGTITSATGVEGIIGVPFNYQIAADNNPTWYSAGSLPEGLRCDGASGVISGIPTRTGTFAVPVEAENLHGSAAATLAISIVDGTIGSGSQPTLSLTQTGDNLRLSWPVTAEGFVLEETQLPPNGWTHCPAQVVVQGNENVAVITTGGTVKFYRLRK